MGLVVLTRLGGGDLPADLFSISAMLADGVFANMENLGGSSGSISDDGPLPSMDPKGQWDVPVNLEQTDLTPHQKAVFTRIVREYYPAFSRHKEDLGLSTVGVELVLDTGDAEPTSQGAYRCSKDEDAWLEAKIRTWVQNRIIRHSNSPWAAPCSLVKKMSPGM